MTKYLLTIVSLAVAFFFFPHLLLSRWQNTGSLTTPSFFVIGPAAWEDTGFSFQIPREGVWGSLGSGTRWGPLCTGRGGRAVGLAAGAHRCTSGEEASANGADGPARPHLSQPTPQAVLFLYVVWCFLRVIVTPPLSNLTLILLFQVNPFHYSDPFILPQNVCAVDTVFICFLACNFRS